MQVPEEKTNVEVRDSPDHSLSLSITPPLSKEESISEHLSSIENDRSIPELEITQNFNFFLNNLPEDERISQEAQPALDSNTNTSIISLNGLERFIGLNMEGRHNVQSILEDILNNDQFKSDEESLNIFANVDLDDKLLNSYNNKSAQFSLGRRVRDFEELLAEKEGAIAALTSELDSYREMISNTSTNSLGTSTTEYRQFQEECHHKLAEYHSAIVQKDEQIEKLTNSLQQSVLMREHLKSEIGQLKEQLEKTTNSLREHKCLLRPDLDFSETCTSFETMLDFKQMTLFKEIKVWFQSELDKKKKELEDLKMSNVKHSKEMEELRTYFEKKCLDLEKNYSEEIFSQQSRKLSNSTSSCSDELSLDFGGLHQPGPGGDSKSEYTKKDLLKLSQSLEQMLDLFKTYKLEDLNEHDFDKLKSEIAKHDLKSLLKFDLISVKNELQNKYHAELEILREDFDNRVDLINVENEERMKELEKKYLEEIEDLNVQLRGRVVSTAQQEVANSGEFEIDEVVQSYERRLQEQVTLAKLDIISALETQIQRLVSVESLDEEWPEELLQLKARFSEKYQKEIELLNVEHSKEIQRLKEEHLRSLERARRRSLRDADSLSKGEIELLKERDALKKQTLSLRHLLGELIKYFTQCEDELNSTLVEELIAKNEESPVDSINVTRVHITPNFSDLINLIDSSSENDLDSIDLKSELGSCLEKLKSDANAILQLSTTFKNDEIKPKSISTDKDVSSLTRKLINETQIKNTLIEELNEVKSVVHTLETSKNALEVQVEELVEREKVLERDLLKAHAKIAELIENGHREIISEGYGENGDKGVKGLVEAVAVLAALQDKLLGENPGLPTDILTLVGDLTRAANRVAEEAKKETDDFMLQIEAADKKYKKTCEFLEEQAAEREQERDEAQKVINTLKEQLKERERDRANCERFSNEVFHLEQQLRDMSSLLASTQHQLKETQNEHDEAVSKIFELRDIILHLEEQLKSKTHAEEELRNIIDDLEVLVKNNTSTSEVLDIKKLEQYIHELEAEVERLRSKDDNVENAKEIKECLCDLETTLDKRIKDLEVVWTSSTACSSPSEDMSIRDVVDKKVYDECEVPLQQLSRLKEKLVRHARAEEAAVKRVKDMEMMVQGLRTELEESNIERDILKKQISDHLVLISNLQIRLDEQRIRAEHIEKQTNTSLEVQNYDLKNMIAALEEKISKRDKTIGQLKANIEETRKRVQEREKNDELIVENLRIENERLKSKELEFLEQGRRQISGDSLQISPIVRKNETVLEDLSSIENVNLNFLQRANSTEKHVRFEDDKKRIEELESSILEKDNKLAKLEEENHKIKELEDVISEKDRLVEDLEQKLTKINELQTKIDKLQLALEETEASLKQATRSFEDKDKEIASLQEEMRSHEETLTLQNEEIRKLQNEAHDKDLEVKKMQQENEKLAKELKHLQQLLAEKEKIIEHMELDSKSLKTNLESIQNKLQETGNVVDLSRRLREEQKKNSALFEELHELKAQLLGTGIDDITSQVQKELSYSAYLDNTLINAVVSDNSLDTEDLESMKLLLRKQKSVNRQLVKNKDVADRKFDELEKKYEALKKELDAVQYDDAMLIGELRNKLDKAVGNERDLMKVLEMEKNTKRMLESEVKAMKHRLTLTQTNSLPDFGRGYSELSKIVARLEEENLSLKRDLRSVQNSTKVYDLEMELAEMRSNEQELKMKIEKLKSETRKVTKLSDPISEQLLTKIHELNEMVKKDRKMMELVERLRQENRVLENRIVTLEDRRELPFDDATSRANYLFAKYLRSESYRKALAWQKQYLFTLVPPMLMTTQTLATNRFRCVVTMVISVCRMKYLVRRWHSGRRIREQRVATNQVQFQVGQPVSSQNFATTKSALNEPNKTAADLPLFGSSPPSKECALMKRDSVLTSPALLSKYIERFNQIQDKLGLDPLT